MNRRSFFGAATAASAALALPRATSAEAPYRVKVPGRSQAAPVTGAFPMPSTIAMGSGAPLGGIGTGFVEIRPNGCFYEWQILNNGQWSAHTRRAGAAGAPAVTPPNLRFLLWTNKPGGAAQLRRLYLRSDENDLYSLGYAQDVESIDYEAWYPMTTLRYRDSSLPVKVSAEVFSPFLPGNARDSATPGFHMVFTLENTSRETVEASLLSVLDNPIVSTAAERKLKNTVIHSGASASLLMESDATPEDKSDLGSMCLSVAGGEPSWMSGTFRSFALPGLCRWQSGRVNSLQLDMLQDYFRTGRLPNTSIARDPSQDFKLTAAEIDALSTDALKTWLTQLTGDALINRVVSEARIADAAGADTDDQRKLLLKEIARNFTGGNAGTARDRSTWGTGALASNVTLAPGERVEVRFTLGWFFPHHINDRGEEIGHMYANWFKSAADVNEHLSVNYDGQRAGTENFARTIADTSLGNPLAFVWSSQLGTLIKNTWWSKAGNYAIWEGLGCCGLSTTDVDFDGSSSIVALFPELKLSQMKHIAAFQNEQGEVPHNYSNGFVRIDRGGYRRVDMNPQWVMMVCRDYLWTADRDYLQAMWPGVVKAMDHTGSLDSDGDGLPDKDCGFQTYDQWRMRGAPSYIASLWIGALRSAIRLAHEMEKPEDAQRWQALLAKASASFDKVLFNGEFYSLWVDGVVRDEICMSDQISGEWFSHLMGLDTTISEQNLARAVDSIWKNNYSPEIGLRNATAPRGGVDVPAMGNLQAGGVWSGIEFAFASFLMDHGRYDEGARLAEAVHRRYLRAGMPWNHVECGGHYTRAMSSWATLLAATGFKPDWPAQTLTLAPTAPGNFHAPWVTASGFGTVRRQDKQLTLECRSGSVSLTKLRLNLPQRNPKVNLAGKNVDAKVSADGAGLTLIFFSEVVLRAGESLVVG